MNSRLAFGNASLLGAFICLLGAPLGHGSDIVVAGKVRHEAVLKAGNAAATTYEVTTERYIVEAGPANVGSMIILDNDLVQSLCRDKDGCYAVLQMVNWDAAGQPGNVASRTAQLFLSETSEWWRLADLDIAGLDDNNSISDWSIFDCFFSDAETGGGDNVRSDEAAGFGLLNTEGGSYSDATTTCRLLLSD